MRTSTPFVSLVSSLAVAALALAPITVQAAPKGDAVDPDEEETPSEESDDEGEGEPEEGEELTPEEQAAADEAAAEEAAAEEAAAAEAAAAEEEAAAAEAAAAEEAAAEEAAAAEAAAAEEEESSFLDEEDDRPPEPRIANKPAKGKGLMIAGGAVAGVGIGLTTAFALMTRKCSFDGPLQCSLEDQDDFLIPMGAATLITGAMVLAVGVGYHFRYKRWEAWSPEDDKKVALIPMPTALKGGGGGLVWAGRF